LQSQFSVPNGDPSQSISTYGSGSGRWGRTNDGIFGGTPDDTNGIYGLEDDYYLANMTSLNYQGTSLEIKVHVRAQNFSAGSDTDFDVLLYTDGSTLDKQENFGTSDSWQNFTMSTNIAKTAAQLNPMRVRVICKDPSFDTRISEIEVEVVLTSSSSSSSSFSSCSSSSSSCDSAFSSSSSSSCSSSFSSCSSSSSSCDSAFSSSSSSSCSSSSSFSSSSSSSQSFSTFQTRIWMYPTIPDDLTDGFEFGAGSAPGSINNGIYNPDREPGTDDTNGIGSSSDGYYERIYGLMCFTQAKQ
jgi:hypothetical protein